MNLSVKRCLLGLVACATMFGSPQAQGQEPVGTVQLGPPAISGGSPIPQGPVVVDDYGVTPAPSGSGAVYGMTRVDRIFNPRVNIDSRGGSLYGYDAGYSNIGVFYPWQIDQNSIFFVHGMGMVTYDSRGGATVGTGWRHYMDDIDRIVGLSVWFDFDNGHAKPYQQVGLSLESLGRYVDYRVNGYIPVSNADHVLYSQLTPNSILYGSGIGLIRNNLVEQSYTGFDAETGGPVPYLGRYGLNAYIGGYYFTGNGYQGGDFTGVSGRILAQINEDASFGVQVTNDHVFGLNTQFQVFLNLPDGKPGRWFRNPRVYDRLVQNVFRQNRVMAKTNAYTSVDVAINPETNKPYFVANIDPNLATGGNGQANSPFGSIEQYLALSQSQRQMYDIILVQPRSDSTNTNLDTAATFELYNGQRLLSTSVEHTFLTANLPDQTMILPGFTGGSAPMLYNSSGGDVITMIGGNNRRMEISGFDIEGSATGNGIRGHNNLAVSINQNTIHDGLNGVLLTNASGTIANGTQLELYNNTIENNIGSGFVVVNSGSPPAVNPLDVIVQGNLFSGNGFDGLRLDARAGATIGGIIGGYNTAATDTTPAITRSNTFDGNGANGLNLLANGGTLLFQGPSSPTTTATTTETVITQFGVPDDAYGIYNNTFTTNTLDGLHIQTTNNSVALINVINNNFGVESTLTSGNQQFGIGLVADSGLTNIVIGGDLIENADGTFSNPGNAFNYNAVSAINMAVGGTAVLSYDIINNSIANGATSTVAAPHDSFTFSFNGTSGTDPFIITNTSDPGIEITSVVWNLAGTPATIAATNQGTNGTVNPVVLQPISDSLLTSLNGLAVTTGSTPLLISGLNAPATNANSGMAAGSQIIPMGFTGFDPADVFSATSRFEIASGSSPLTSAATNGSSITVNFSNGLSSTQRVTQLDPTSNAVSATGDVFGTSIPGFGNGGDGIHVASSGNSVVTHANISNNSVSGYGGYGVRVETSGNSNSSNVLIQNNEITNNGTGINGAGVSTFTGGGLALIRNDSSTLNAIIDSNSISANFNDGIVLKANGTATGGMTVSSRDNEVINNAGNGLDISSTGDANLKFTTLRDNFNGNGAGSGNNIDTNGGDNISIVAGGNSVLDITLENLFSDGSSGTGQTSNGVATGNGLSATTNADSTLNLLIVESSFSNNRLNGIVLNSNGRSYMHASIYDTRMNSNTENGILFNRASASLVRANIVNSSMQSNLVNGFNFHGLGNDPDDPTQMYSGPNRINLINDSLNNNGINGVGQGARVDLLGDATLVLNANATTFNNNAQNGLRVSLSPGNEFGYTVGNERSTFDNVQINNNGSNGIFMTSTITPTDPNTNNPVLPYDAPSATYMQISANTGSTEINNNGFGANATGLSGILAQYLGGNHDILIEGDVVHATPQYGTVIQGNRGDGIFVQSAISADTTVSVDRVLVGGPLAINANGGHGINFQAVSKVTIVDGADTTTWLFNGAGTATLNVDQSVIQGNTLNGINLFGNGFSDTSLTSDGTGNFSGDPGGDLNANITNSDIVDNGGSGINILLQGNFGGFRYSASGIDNTRYSTFNIAGNRIQDNGQFGLRMEQNAGYANTNYFVDFIDTNAGADPEIPFNPYDAQPNGFGNTSDNANIRDAYLLSNYLFLPTLNNAKLNLYDNLIQYNGRAGDLRNADGVFIRVSTQSYLAADIQNNRITGNVANDLHIESFVQYNPTNGLAWQPILSTRATPPDLSRVYLDYTAQMDLRLKGNIGNTLNIQDPTVNYWFNGNQYVPLDGNSTPNGAVLGSRDASNEDPYKDNNISNFGFTNPTPRLVQLFQIDDAANLNSTNYFNQNGTTQDVYDAFYNADFYMRTIADPDFPNPTFPQYFSQNPGNPFLP